MERSVDLVSGIRSKTIAVELCLDDTNRCIRINCSTSLDSNLCFNTKPISHTISFPDIVGCQLLKSASNDAACYMGIYAYPIPPGDNNNKSKRMRRRQEFTLRFGKKDNVDNRQEVETWVQAINTIIVPPPPAHSDSINSSGRRLLVLVNPKSGPGKALQIFQKNVMPVFAEAGIISKLVVTEYSKHAQYLMQTIDLSHYHGIVIVSGDGLCFEVLNGLFLREDRQSALNIPIGTIPGGSGNALASAIAYQNDEPFDGWNDFSTQSAVIISRPIYQPLKLVHVETLTENYAGFMAAAWGLLSDIDIESEKYRKPFGIARFEIYTTIRLMFLRSYRGRLSYLPIDEAEDTQINTHSSCPLTKSTSEFVLGTGRGDCNLTKTVGSLDIDETSLNGQAKVHAQFHVKDCDSIKNVVPPPTKSAAELRWMWAEGRDPSIPFINEPVPDSWTVVEDDFTFIHLVFLSHIGQDLPFLPRSRMDDDVIYLVFMKSAEVSRYTLLTFLMAVSNEEHVLFPQVKIIPCKSVRIEALSGSGVMTLDGEVLEGQTMQATVTRFNATVMGKSK